MNVDLLIKNGRVIDPARSFDGPADVAVRDGRIVSTSPSISVESAREVVDASGLVVTPGLVDLHTHIYHGATFYGVDPYPIASRSGVTTWVDAGSSGAFTVDAFRRYIAQRAPLRIRAFLNISCVGLAAHDYELSQLAFCEPDLFALTVEANRDLIVGAKVRMGASTVGDNGIEPMRRARAALDLCGLPMMVHIATPPPAPEDYAHLLRAGDVVTHAFTGQGMKLVDDAGRLRPFARRWLDDGVRLDLGHGTGSFTFETAEAMLAAGVKPDFISSDIHLNSVNGPAYDLPTCLNKLLLLGMTLSEVIARATVHPADYLALGSEAGSLAAGRRADIALFRLSESPHTLYDANWQTRTTRQHLEHVATYLAGRRLEPIADPPPPRFLDWRRGGRDDALYAQQARVAAGRSGPADPTWSEHVDE